MLIVHVGSKTWPPRHGGVEKVVFDLATAFPTSSVVFANTSEEQVKEGAPPVFQLRKGFFSSIKQLIDFAKNCNDTPIFHFHKETSIPLALFIRLLGYRCVLTLHGFGWRIARWSYWQRCALWLLDLVAYFCLQRIIFVGQYDWQTVRRWLPLSHLRWIPNGVVASKFARKEVIDADSWVYIGRISPEKNLLGLVEEAAFRGIRLHIYGPLDLRDHHFAACFRKLVQAPGITWHGPLPFEQVIETLKRYGTLVNVSYSEGLPVSVLEGASCGLKLVLSDIPQHKTLNFPCVRYVKPHQLNFEYLPIGDGDDNRQHVLKHYSLDAMIKGYQLVYDELDYASIKK